MHYLLLFSFSPFSHLLGENHAVAGLLYDIRQPIFHLLVQVPQYRARGEVILRVILRVIILRIILRRTSC